MINPVFHMGMRLGPAGRRWVAVLGWIFVALPCLGMAALVAFLAPDFTGNMSTAVPVTGVVESYRQTVKIDGNAIRIDFETSFRYSVDGTEYPGKDSGYSYSYKANRATYPEDPRNLLLEGVPLRTKGDAITVYYDPAAPWRNSLSLPADRALLGGHLLWSVAAGSSGLLLTALGWLYLREPVEIVIASPARADAFTAEMLGWGAGAAGPPGGGEDISEDVAVIRRREGTTEIAFPREGGPAFRPSGLYPPVLLMASIVWYITLKGLGFGEPAGLMAWSLLAGVVGFIALSLGYSQARRALRIRNGVMEVVTTGLLGRRRRRVTRAQVDQIETRWALSEISRFGEAAYFDLVAVLGNGSRLRIAEGLPRVEVADALARLVAREIGLAPEQALSLSAVRSREAGNARDALEAARALRRGPN